jgi:hypothetical protein
MTGSIERNERVRGSRGAVVAVEPQKQERKQVGALRDAAGRFLPGVSGNPGGGGRPSREVNALADTGIVAVLEHDLAVLQDRKAGVRAREAALNRLARIGARRVTARTESEFAVEEAPYITVVLQRESPAGRVEATPGAEPATWPAGKPRPQEPE